MMDKGIKTGREKKSHVNSLSGFALCSNIFQWKKSKIFLVYKFPSCLTWERKWFGVPFGHPYISLFFIPFLCLLLFHSEAGIYFFQFYKTSFILFNTLCSCLFSFLSNYYYFFKFSNFDIINILVKI